MSGKQGKRKALDKLKSKHKKVKVSDESDETFSNLPNVPNKKVEKSNSFKNVRKQQLLEANEEEDKTIRRLENLLKLKKRKKKKLPSVFKDDGLDYLLDVIDSKVGEAILSDGSVDLEEDLAAVNGESIRSILKRKPEKKPTSRPLAKQRTLTELLREKEGTQNSEDEESNDENSSDDEDLESDASSQMDSNAASGASGESENDSQEESEEVPQKPKVWEDIYGRLRDESGKVLKGSETTNKYVPPKLRKKSSAPDERKTEECLRIKRQLKGLLNRLSESNLQNICHQIEEMYMKNSRNDVNETLFSLMSELVFTPTLTPPRLIMEQAMLVALLHANVGSEIGAYFLQHIVEKLGGLFESRGNYGDEKESNNMLNFLSHLYNYKVTNSTLIFDIFHILVESFESKDIELIQLFLKNIGFVLRKDDPLKLKDLIFSIQAKATAFNKDQNDSRVRFMLETLIAIKNNNMYKIPDYDPSIMEHSKKFLRGLIRKGCSIQELAISYEDLLKVDERGRWWIVGSAWAESDDLASKNSKNSQDGKILPKTVVSEKILEFARKQHMNTEVRKSIFCIITTAEDFMDAFEKLLKLNLRNQQEREIIHVILHCALQEKNFNPYYAYLADKFCGFSRRHRICLQYALWDKFKDLSKLKEYQMNNLSRLLSHLFISGALPLSVLKVIHFSEMDKTMVGFFRQILLAILLHESEEVCVRAFTRIAAAENLKLLRESLRLFMHHFVLLKQTKLEPAVALKLELRVKLAENALKSFKRIF